MYALPGRRTIPSSPLTRRHTIASLALTRIAFSHVAVPKLRAAAFLTARIAHGGAAALLPGPAGLTLDGSFVGMTALPACAPGAHFDVALGVDERVRVTYAAPVGRARAPGLLAREHAVRYERRVRVRSSRAGATHLTVRDQVPVCADERCRVVVVAPAGLRAVGDEVALPDGGRAGLAEGGEVWYRLEVGKGAEVALALEYEVRTPAGAVVCSKW